MSKLFLEVERTENKKGQVISLFVEVKAVRSRNHFGRDEVLVTPVRGSGEKWVYKDRLIEKND